MHLNRLIAICWLTLLTPLALANSWEANITNADTPITDAEVNQALGKGISAGFTTAYPARQYGIHVLLDTHALPQQDNAVTYIALGLARRMSSSALELPIGRLSDVVILSKSLTAEEQKTALSDKLQTIAASFSKAMVQNKAAFDQAISSRPIATGHWSEWPDYEQGSGTGSGH